MDLLAQKGNYNYMKITSGAGHDSQVLAQAFPTNMIFVPSVRGISHNEKKNLPGQKISKQAFIFLRDFYRRQPGRS